MKSEHVERKLTTVLAADVAGYSRLMGVDEEGTLARLRTLRRELIDPKIKEHSGRIVKTTGDGMLVEFVSPVEAVRCALAVQAGTARRNTGVPEAQRVEFRVGINLGDVIVENDDLYGDGVNIAARLESIAEPGGICISRTVRDHIRDRLAYPFVDTGEQSVKNIARPIRVYALSAAAIATLPSAEALEGRPLTRPRYARGYVAAAATLAGLMIAGGGLWWLWPLEKPPNAAAALPHLSIVVLPFENLSTDKDQEYFAEGLTDNLTTDLSRISGSFVIARNTAATYKGKAVSVKQIGDDLGVRYALEGSVQKQGTRIRVNAQLIDAQTAAHLWAERFDRDTTDLLEMQDEITRRIASSLSAELVQAESDRSLRERHADPDAVDLTLRGRALLNKTLSPENVAEARGLFEQALAIDPQNADALTGLAETHTNDVLNDWAKVPAESSRQAYDAMTRALEINPRNAVTYVVKSNILTFGRYRNFDQAIEAAKTAIALNPSLANAYARLGRLYARVGKPERTAELVQQAMRLSPRDPNLGSWLYAAGISELQMGHYDEAIDTFRRSVTANPHLAISWESLTAAYLGAGRDQEARQTFAELQKLTRTTENLPESPDERMLVMRAKVALMQQGRWAYSPDDYKDPAFIKAMKSFQHDENLPETGIVDEATLARLSVKPPAAVRPPK